MSLFYWRAFWALSSSRLAGMDGPLPITLSEMSAYCHLAGIVSPQARMDFCHFMQAMDAEWLDFQESKKPRT